MTRYQQQKILDAMMSDWIAEKKKDIEEIGEDYLLYVAGYFQSVLLDLAVDNETVTEKLISHFGK